MKLSGIYTISNGELGEMKTLNIYFESDFTMDSSIFKKDFSMKTTYNYQTSYTEDITIVVNGKFAKVDNENEMFGYKGMKIRNYETDDYEYSYQIEGKIYIFTDEVYGYFYIDNSYDHSATPIRKDSCDLYIYSGTEKYIGKNSSMTWEIISTNRYKVMIDNDDDGVIDTVFTGATED